MHNCSTKVEQFQHCFNILKKFDVLEKICQLVTQNFLELPKYKKLEEYSFFRREFLILQSDKEKCFTFIL